MFICLEKGRYQLVVICYDIDAIGYDRRTPELSNAQLNMKQETGHQQYREKDKSVNTNPRLRLRLTCSR